MREPERTCVGCRGQGRRDELVRVVAGQDGRVVLDLERKLPGRGAWLHRREACFAEAAKRKVFGRAFRRPLESVDGSALWDGLTQQRRSD